ncbi:MAG: DDE-type integrase/transposase/recombinase, partial [Nanoarchaeota archaeon]|nr:DDE-type integrase/transposase/recombinase [Nanoarchaeota archaeon]MBU1875831.1 DDE-type integrase/transposase/recombinase [Nanoarchaeota archaeon]
MYKLTFKKRVWIIKQFQKGDSALKIALAQNIHRRAIYQIIDKYKEFGWDGLKDHKTGRSEIILNQSATIIILDLRKRFGYGALHIKQILKKQGFAISHRQIEKVLVRNGLVIANPKKQKPRKWVRYELPNPNDLWHTDWSHDPFTDKNISVYIDDRTRLITSYGVFKRATTENSLALLYSGIFEYGKPKAVMTVHGSQYYGTHPNSKQENHIFRATLDVLGIKHSLARINRPQTNGKVER